MKRTDKLIKYSSTSWDNKSPEYKEPGYYLITGCWHAPFINLNLFSCFLQLFEYLTKEDLLKGHFIIGDFLDMHSISRHNKGKITIPGLLLEDEYDAGNTILDRLDQINPDIEKLYLYGNHEAWYDQRLAEVDMAKLGKKVVKSPAEALFLEERGYTVLTDSVNAEATLGDTTILHGHWCNKHSAHKHLTELKRNAVFVHTHRQNSYADSHCRVLNLGWMGNKEAKVFNYMSKQQKEAWRNGFGAIYLDEDGKSHAIQIDFNNNKIVFGGKVFRNSIG